MNMHWMSSSDARGFSLTMRCHNCSGVWSTIFLAQISCCAVLSLHAVAWAGLQHRHGLFEKPFFEGPPFSLAQLGFE